MGFGDKIRGAKWRENHRTETLRRIYTTACVGSLVTAELPEPELEPVEQAEWRLVSGALNRITADNATKTATTPAVHIPQQPAAPAIETIQPAVATG
ncbi:MAG TPA: hypothetical protein VFI84_03405 [Candidatus Saccharimonadales bacterium]|nr:hypothetical protein [Candidatus Saccharimonadales bacterium]